MNFEQLLTFFLKNYHFIKNKKKFLHFLKNSYLTLKLKKQKLKLGLIVFEVKEHKAPGTPFILFETIDIRFIRQDNTEEDEQKFETRLNKLNIKNKKLFFVCFFLIFFFLSYFLISHFIYSIEDGYMSFFLKKEILSIIIKSLFKINIFQNLSIFVNNINDFLIDSIINLSTIYKFLL